MSEHWTARTERVTSGDFRVLGEDDRGDLYVPRVCLYSGQPVPYWHDLYNPWNPTHWRYWLRSRVTMRIAFLERVGGAS